jgi:hypothetical protein
MEVKKYVNHLKEKMKRIDYSKLKFCIVQMNDDPASNAYVKGKIKDIEVLQSPDQSLSDAVIEILHKANDLRRGWDPGKDEDGNAVNMEFTLPISFKLMQ